MLELFKEVRDLSGQMKGIEKRLEDKDKLVEATVKLRIIEEIEKLRSEFATKPPSPPT
jgi:DNA-binding FrmR family transcriptional regulator